MLKLKLQYFGHLMQKVDSLKKILMIWANSQRQLRTEESGVLYFVGLQRVGHDLVTEQQQWLIHIVIQQKTPTNL